MNVYPFIEAEKQRHAQRRQGVRADEGLPVRLLRTTAARPVDPQQCSDAELGAAIAEVHRQAGGTYGAPRVHAELATRDGGTPASASPG